MALADRNQEQKPNKDNRQTVRQKLLGLKKRKRAESLSQIAAQRQIVHRMGLGEFLVVLFYKMLYILGVTLLRRLRRIKKQLRRLNVRLKEWLLRMLEHPKRGVQRFCRSAVLRIRAPFRKLKTTYRDQKPAIRSLRARGKFPLRAYLLVMGAALRLLRKVAVTLLNYLIPVAALIFLLNQVELFANRPMGLEVQYNGETIGIVEKESDFDRAVSSVRSRFVAENMTTLNVPVFTLISMEDKKSYTPVDTLADNLIGTSYQQIEQAVGLYVDNRFFGAVADKDFLFGQLDSILDESRMGVLNEKVDYLQNIKVTEGLFPTTSLESPESLAEKMRANVLERQIYVVKEGETFSDIAERAGIPVVLLRAYNPGLEELEAGQELITAVERPVLSVKNIFTTVYEEEMSYPVEEIKSAIYSRNYREVARQGENGVRQVTAEISLLNGQEIERRILEAETVILKEPVAERVIVGTNDPMVRRPQTLPNSDATPSQSGFIWPTQGGVITVGINGYPGHTGVDIPRNSGVSIFAAADGVVVRALNTTVNYGRYIIIEHDNGFQTLYAHCSALYVAVGDRVTQGQVIAAVGRTGRATGNHLHFEVRRNGQTLNPRNYIG